MTSAARLGIVRLLVVLASSCGAALAATIELKLGGAIGFTGKYATSALHCHNGWELWAKRLNELGGVQLPNGDIVKVKLPLDLRDDMSSGFSSQALLERMLNSTSPEYAALDFVIGPFSSGITGGNAQIAASHHKILFSHGASESLYSVGNGYIFSVLTPGKKYMASGLEVLANTGAKSVVFAHEEKSFSTSVCQGGNLTAHLLGLDVRGYYSYPPGTQNFAETIYDIKKQNPDVIVGCGHISDINYLIGQMVLLDVNPPAMLVTHAADNRIIQNVAAKSHALLSPTQWHKDLTFADDDGFFGSALDFHNKYVETYDLEPPYQAAYAAAMGYALQKAIETAGTTETEAVRSALYNLQTDSFYGPISFSRADHPSSLLGTMPDRPMVTTQVLFKEIGVVAPPSAANFQLLYPSPPWTEKDLLVHPCALGEEEKLGICVPCTPGYFRDANLLQCRPCLLGTFTAKNGTSRCDLCSKGSFGATLGQSSCEHCEPGSAAVEQGMSVCPACRPGHFMNITGAADCLRCPEGFYANGTGSVKCVPCTEGKTTRGRGAISIEECICVEGEYYRPGVGCVTCPIGLGCSGGNQVPTQDLGFYVEVLDEAARNYQVLQCVHLESCPAGPLSKCAAPFAGRSCAVCGTDAANPTHRCDGCTLWTPFVTLPLWLLFLYVICKVSDSKRHGKITAVSMLFGNLAIAISTVQSVNIVLTFFSKLPEELEWMAVATNLAMLDISLFMPGCNFGTSFLARYTFTAMMPFLVVMGYMCIYALVRLLSWCSSRIEPLAFDAVFNAAGMLLQTLYVLLCKESLGYFMAQPHPAAPDTLALYPDVYRWQADHISVIWAAITFIMVFVVGMYSVLVYAVYTSPAHWADMGFRKRFRFAFGRWRPSTCYWGLIMLARNLLVSLVPALISDGMTFRVSAVIFLTVGHAIGEAWYQPWLTCMNNVVEISMSLLLVLISVGSLTSGLEGPSGTAGYVLMTGCFVLIWVLFFVATLTTVGMQLRFVLSRDQVKVDDLEEKLTIISRQFAEQEDDGNAQRRKDTIGCLSWYDRTSLTHAAKLILEELLDDSKSSYRRVRFSFLQGRPGGGPANKTDPAKLDWQSMCELDLTSNSGSASNSDAPTSEVEESRESGWQSPEREQPMAAARCAEEDGQWTQPASGESEEEAGHNRQDWMCSTVADNDEPPKSMEELVSRWAENSQQTVSTNLAEELAARPSQAEPVDCGLEALAHWPPAGYQSSEHELSYYEASLDAPPTTARKPVELCMTPRSAREWPASDVRC
eukprot:TRINITY_DN15002_c0_g1_i1.p1 TRINITY_DN15002_c0_g1~~TRINITY_DN15002_c0_g1_i1.p1  ORF type:complete len:1276 (-),score=262.81 TRINITY_DN15002_c0_g1_i1:201-4028(-)